MGLKKYNIKDLYAHTENPNVCLIEDHFVIFQDCEVANDTNLTTLEQCLDIKNKTDILGIRFRNVIFKGRFQACHLIWNVSASKKIKYTFSNVNFEKDASFEDCTYNEELSFRDVIFNANINFNNSILEKKVLFTQSKFKGIAQFQGMEIKSDFFVTKCEFEKEVNLAGSTSFKSFEIKSRCNFYEKAIFSGVAFNEIRIENSMFKMLLFPSTIVAGNAYFKNLEILEDAIFNEVDFKGKTWFEDILFKGKFYLWQSKIHKYLTISLEFKKHPNKVKECKIDFNFSNLQCLATASFYLNNINGNSHDSKIILKGATIEGVVGFNNININQITLDNVNLNGTIISDNVDIHGLISRNTARLFKISAIKMHDSISFLKWNAKETEAYRKEIQWNWENELIKWFNNISLFKCFIDIIKRFKICINKFVNILLKIQNRIVLFFNKISNNYGQSWLRGVFFTLGVALITFSIAKSSEFEIALDWDKNIQFIKDYYNEFFKYLFSLNFGYEINGGFGRKALTALITGKIFIGYGIYQTIAAFRKFRDRN